MSVIAGVVHLNGRTSAPIEYRIESIASGGNGRATKARTESGFFAGADTGPGTLPPIVKCSGDILYAADAGLDNREELAAILGISKPELSAIGDEELLLQIYRRRGEAGLARCLGAFAFALWDAKLRRLILARDYGGARSLFFHRGTDFVIFATTLRALLAVSEVPRQIDERLVADYLALVPTEARKTFYREVERVPSRTVIAITPGGMEHRHYWSPKLDVPPPYKRDEDYVERARELLDQSVATATRNTPQVAISTSGGLDSSAIAATAARLGQATSVSCFCIVPPEDMKLNISARSYLDEREKVEALARMRPALRIRYCVEGGLHPYEEEPDRYFLRAATPIRNPCNFGAFVPCYEAVAADGHRALLIGAMGNMGLSWSGGLSLVSLLRMGMPREFLHEFAAVAGRPGRGFARTLRSDVLRPLSPPILRRLWSRFRGRDPDSVAAYSALNPAYIVENGLDRAWRERGLELGKSPTDWNAARLRALFMFDFNQIARDTHAQSPALFGFETRDPHADRRLLEFLLTVPEPLFRRNGVERSFARAVLADRLPPEIVDERRIGYQGATWFRRMDARRDKIAAEIDRLEASPLASRLIDVARLKQILAAWPADESAAQARAIEIRHLLHRGIHVGRFIRWVEGGNA